MSNLPRFLRISENRIPVELAGDFPFRFLVEAFEGRSKAALRHGQRYSVHRPRQRFLDLVKGKYPKAEVKSLVNTIGAALQLYDKIPSITAADFVFLDALLRFMKEYDLVSEGQFETISDEIKARINLKTGNFEAYLAEWNGRTQRESFDWQAVQSADLAERMYRNKQEALRRLEERRAREREVRQEQEEAAQLPPLGEELRNREPTSEDLSRLTSEERALVHAIATRLPGSTPINWIAIESEHFRNRLTRRNYEALVALEQEGVASEQSDNEHFATPPQSPTADQ
jgi:hypothetical protein